MTARYRFRVRFRLSPSGVAVDPATFETTVTWPAAAPGEEGWLFFRDRLWRGEVNDPTLSADLAERLGVPVEDVSFRAFEVDPASYAAFRDAVRADLAAFRADDVPEVVTKYLGSKLEVLRGD